MFGDWKSKQNCLDPNGSFQGEHPWACHLTGLPKDCGIIGNGAAYPVGMFPYPPLAQGNPATAIMGGCYEDDIAMPAGTYFFEYHSLPTPGGSAPLCAQYATYKALADSDPVHYKIAGVSKGCGDPVGSICFPSRIDNACF